MQAPRQDVSRNQRFELAPGLPQDVGIGERAMTCLGRESMTRNQCIETMLRFFRKQLARKFDGAQHLAAQRVIEPLECIVQEAVIEARIMCDE
jgi:hypothetical protein